MLIVGSRDLNPQPLAPGPGPERWWDSSVRGWGPTLQPGKMGVYLAGGWCWGAAQKVGPPPGLWSIKSILKMNRLGDSERLGMSKRHELWRANFATSILVTQKPFLLVSSLLTTLPMGTTLHTQPSGCLWINKYYLQVINDYNCYWSKYHFYYLMLWLMQVNCKLKRTYKPRVYTLSLFHLSFSVFHLKSSELLTMLKNNGVGWGHQQAG